MLKNGLFMT